MDATASILQPPRSALETEQCTAGALLGGKYRLVHQVGEGGMANIWLARNEFLDLPVALKIVRPEIRGSETAARLLTEARVQANLRHPNVARVYDYGQTAAGDAFIVMELLEGYSLTYWIEREGPLSAVTAVQIMLPIIDALCAAHRAGVVHRDLKPDNIFISHPTTDLCPKLLDFGIAKLNTEFNPRLTGRGGVIGSPAYMAPEQARGFVDCDERVDVWAACVVLYEAITGKPAFDGSNHLALMLAVIEEELEPLAGPDCEDLWPILSAGLVKERETRTASMITLGGQLAKWLAARGAKQDLGGEPVFWRYAFTPSDADVARPAQVARAFPSPRSSNDESSRVRSERHLSSRERSYDRRAADRRTPTPLVTVRRAFRTNTLSPAQIRKAAALRIGGASCAGVAVLLLGMTQGPLSWLLPRPEATFAMADEKSAPHVAQPARPEQLAQRAQPERDALVPPPPVVAQLPAAKPDSRPARSTQPLLAQTVRPQPDLTQIARRAYPPRVNRAATEAASKHAGAKPTRAQLELAAFLDPQGVSSDLSKDRTAQPEAGSESASDVVTVRPRSKPVQPSEAELGLKRPW